MLFEIPETVIQILRRPLPPEAIKPHPTKSYLSTIKAIYAVERLNEAFGLNGWKVKNELVELHETRNEKTGKVNTMVVMKSFLTVPEYGIEVEAYGGNDNEDRGDAYKGACTDALTKICSYIYVGMDVYKGIKSTADSWEGSGSQTAAEEMAKQKIADLKAGKPYRGPEPPTAEVLQASIDQAKGGKKKAKLSAKRIDVLQAFGELKKRFKALKAESTYYGVLGGYGFEHSDEFADTDAGLEAARDCYKSLSLELAELEAKNQSLTETA